MSKYSGKCDLYDSIGDYNDEDIATKVRIYYADSIVPLDIKNQKDIMPFYPFVAGVMFGESDGTRVFHIGRRSYVDEQEEEFVSFAKCSIERYYNKCKRKRVEFTVEDLHPCTDLERKMAEDVMRIGIKNVLVSDEYHTYMGDYYRKMLYKDMVAAGWDPFIALRWIFGWRRAMQIEKNLDDFMSEGE